MNDAFILIINYSWKKHHVCTRLCCQSPALASIEEDGYRECSVELALHFEADFSTLPDGVKTASSTDLANRKSGSLVSRYVVCE